VDTYTVAVSPDGALFAYGREDGSLAVARNPFAASPVIRIGAIVPSAPGQFQLSVACPTGSSFTIETSTDLSTWGLWTNVTRTGDTTLVLDVPPPGTNVRFYRVKQP